MDNIVLEMRRPPVPCKGCEAPKRHIGCHGECGDFADWKAECDALRDVVRKAREDEAREHTLRCMRAGWHKGANYR